MAGDFLRSSLRVGYDYLSPVNGDAGIGSVFIGRNFEASDIIASAVTGPDYYFGNADDTLIRRGNASIARIASVIIKGAVLGTADVNGDHYGIVAEEIQTLVVGDVTQPLAPGARNDLEGVLLATSGDVRAREVK